LLTIFIVGLLIGAGILFLMARTNIIKGENGVDGIDGKDGVIGPVGPPGRNGTKGVKGDVGATGANGSRGDTGSPGRNGVNAPINKYPTITIKNMSGMKATCSKKVNYSVVVTVLDPDDDNVVITFFYDMGEGYIPVKEVVGESGDYEAHVIMTVPTSFEWIVKVWDGQDISILIQDVVIV
jgi:hypothetical protein